jgi:hypothetical protein
VQGLAATQQNLTLSMPDIVCLRHGSVHEQHLGYCHPQTFESIVPEVTYLSTHTPLQASHAMIMTACSATYVHIQTAAEPTQLQLQLESNHATAMS